MYTPINTSTALARNGTRQPQLKNWASLRLCVNSTKTTVEHKNPSGAPSCGKQPYQASLPGGAFSVASSTAPPHSPPSPIPWPSRQTASKTPASTPIEEYVGSAPIKIVEMPIVNNAVTSVALRPTRSPKWPNSAEPIGLAKNANAKVAKDCKTAVAGSY